MILVFGVTETKDFNVSPKILESMKDFFYKLLISDDILTFTLGF